MIDDIEIFLGEHNSRELVSYNAYTSSSTSIYDEIMDIQIEIKSLNGKDLRMYNENEQEILFKHGTKFFVTKRAGRNIWMEEFKDE